MQQNKFYYIYGYIQKLLHCSYYRENIMGKGKAAAFPQAYHVINYIKEEMGKCGSNLLCY